MTVETKQNKKKVEKNTNTHITYTHKKWSTVCFNNCETWKFFLKKMNKNKIKIYKTKIAQKNFKKKRMWKLYHFTRRGRSRRRRRRLRCVLQCSIVIYSNWCIFNSVISYNISHIATTYYKNDDFHVNRTIEIIKKKSFFLAGSAECAPVLTIQIHDNNKINFFIFSFLYVFHSHTHTHKQNKHRFKLFKFHNYIITLFTFYSQRFICILFFESEYKFK